MNTYKCTCKVPNIETWFIVYHTAKDNVVQCRVCGEAWHTTARYASELQERLISRYGWAQLRKTPHYHKREDAIIGEAGSYLDPNLPDVFLRND